MLTADNAYIADICNTDKVLILKKFLASDNSFNKEQPMLNKKKKDLYENCTALRCYHLGGENLHSLMLLSPCW
jgi:uncharacterized protein YfbU (UPF0304 family)